MKGVVEQSRLGWSNVWLTKPNEPLLSWMAPTSGSLLVPVWSCHSALPPPLNAKSRRRPVALRPRDGVATSAGVIRLAAAGS